MPKHPALSPQHRGFLTPPAFSSFHDAYAAVLQDLVAHPSVLGEAWSDVWRVPAGRSGTGHPAAGTVEIARRCVRLGCPRGGVVLDPFCGSGTTGIAALERGCSFVGVDLDPACAGLARRRLAEVAAS